MWEPPGFSPGEVQSGAPIRERALALVDACTWPDLLWQEDAQRVTHTLMVAGGNAALLRAFTPDDLGALLSSPLAAVRTWSMTTVLPRHIPLPPPTPVDGGRGAPGPIASRPPVAPDGIALSSPDRARRR